MNFTIYVLKDPRDGLYYWIGQTKNFQARSLSHTTIRTDDKYCPKYKERKTAILKDGLIPIVEIVDEFEGTRKEAHWWERHYISLYRSWGFPIINVANLNRTEEFKKNLSLTQKGKHHSEETKKKMSKSQKGSNHWNYGKHTSKEVKEKISQKLKGSNNPLYRKPKSEETKKKMSKARKLYLERKAILPNSSLRLYDFYFILCSRHI